jgi:hypothetical protein
MDIETPWPEDSRRVQAEKERVEKLTFELGMQVLRKEVKLFIEDISRS